MYETIGKIIESFLTVVIASAFCVLNIFDKLKDTILAQVKYTLVLCRKTEKYIDTNLIYVSYASRKRRSENPFLEYCLRNSKEKLRNTKCNIIPEIKADFEGINRYFLGSFVYPQFFGCCLYLILIILAILILPTFFSTYNNRLICLLETPERILFTSMGWITIFFFLLLLLLFLPCMSSLKNYYIDNNKEMKFKTIYLSWIISLLLWWLLNYNCNLKIIPDLILFDFNKMVFYFIIIVFPLAFFFIKCSSKCLRRKDDLENIVNRLMFCSSSFPYFIVK